MGGQRGPSQAPLVRRKAAPGQQALSTEPVLKGRVRRALRGDLELDCGWPRTCVEEAGRVAGARDWADHAACAGRRRPQRTRPALAQSAAKERPSE